MMIGVARFGLAWCVSVMCLGAPDRQTGSRGMRRRRRRGRWVVWESLSATWVALLEASGRLCREPGMVMGLGTHGGPVQDAQANMRSWSVWPDELPVEKKNVNKI